MDNDYVPYGLIIIVLVTIGYFIETYKFKDCKKVGHSTMYCILSIGG